MRVLVAGAFLLSLVTAGVPAGAASPEPEAAEATVPAVAAAPNPRLAPALPVLMTEGFEGSFPSAGWSVFDGDGTTNGEYFWGKEACRKHAGGYSAWAAGAGANGSALDCNGYYPLGYLDTDWVSWMVYGPFDLSGYADAELEFWYWNVSENNFDPLSWLASGDGATWVEGGRHSGISGGGPSPIWVQQSFDLGPWTGDRSVWIAFKFVSDPEKNWQSGPFVDDIVLRALPRATFRSVAANDGWVRESTETSRVGGVLNADAVTCRVGDDGTDRQYRSILDFNTKSLPDNAVILSAVLEIRRTGIVGDSPFSTHGALVADIRTGAFSNAMALQTKDFQARATLARAARFSAFSPDGWYRASLSNEALSLISTTGRTQFRLRFLIDDDDDQSADYLSFNCGDALAGARRPALRITYVVVPEAEG